MTRLWQPRETRLLSEWVSKNFPNDNVMFRVRLGSIPSWAQTGAAAGASADIYKVYQRWADALIIKEEELILIEAKIKPNPGVISQIQLYAQLIPKTPELSKFKERPLRKIILLGIRDAEIEEMAKDNGIEIELYSPPWIIDYLKEIKKYRERY